MEVGDPNMLEKLSVWRVLLMTAVERSWICVRVDASACAVSANRGMASDNFIAVLCRLY